MSRYELLYIIPATYAETELQPVTDGITAILKKAGATIARNEMVGKLKLAYPVGKARHGFYVLVDLDVESNKLGDIDNALRLHTDVIRHQMMVKDQKAKPMFKLTSVEEIERAKDRAATAKETTRTRQTSAAPKTEGKKAEVNMADIDQKLDKIIEGKII